MRIRLAFVGSALLACSVPVLFAQDAAKKTEVRDMKAGDSMYTPHTVHLPENVSDHPMDAVLIELPDRTALASEAPRAFVCK